MKKALFLLLSLCVFSADASEPIPLRLEVGNTGWVHATSAAPSRWTELEKYAFFSGLGCAVLYSAREVADPGALLSIPLFAYAGLFWLSSREGDQSSWSFSAAGLSCGSTLLNSD